MTQQDVKYVAWKAFRAGFMEGAKVDARGLGYEALSATADETARRYADAQQRGALNHPIVLLATEAKPDAS